MKGLRQVRIAKQKSGKKVFILGQIDPKMARRASQGPAAHRLHHALNGYRPQIEGLLEKVAETKNQVALKTLAQFVVDDDGGDWDSFTDSLRYSAKVGPGEDAFVIPIGREYGVFVGKADAVLQAIDSVPKKLAA